MNIVATRCGWARFSAPTVDGAVRFRPASTGRMVVVELVAAGDPRAAALGTLEAWANGPGLDAMKVGVLDRSLEAGAALEQVDAAERAEAPRRAAWGTGAVAEAHQNAALALTAEPGPGDDFYAEVARAYGEAAVAGPNPARAVADANGVAVEKVYQWVKEARRRELMPPARRRATARRGAAA